jgi:hypothetical protein
MGRFVHRDIGHVRLEPSRVDEMSLMKKSTRRPQQHSAALTSLSGAIFDYSIRLPCITPHVPSFEHTSTSRSIVTLLIVRHRQLYNQLGGPKNKSVGARFNRTYLEIKKRVHELDRANCIPSFPRSTHSSGVTRSEFGRCGPTTRSLIAEKTHTLGSGVGIAESAASSSPLRVLSANT